MTVFSRDVAQLQKQETDDGLPHRFAASLFKHVTPALAYGGEEKAAAAIQEHFAMLNEQACSPETARVCLIKAVAIVNLHVTKNVEAAEPAAARELLDESAFNAEWNLERTKEQLTALCRDYIASIGRRQEKGGRKLIRDIVAYITEHYAEKITLEQTAKHFYVNKTYLSELFKTETGTNFTRRLNDIRLEQAKRLMTHTDMTVTEIAERVGFADFRYFCRVFKNHMGMTPTEFKAKALA
jgi:YesN/AraC family two-component response regulator